MAGPIRALDQTDHALPIGLPLASPGPGREIRALIDHRQEPERADVERQILGSLVKAMTLSKLQSLGKPSRLQ